MSEYNGEDYDGQAIRADFKTRDYICPICGSQIWTNCYTVVKYADGRCELHRGCSTCHIMVIYEGCDASKEELEFEIAGISPESSKNMESQQNESNKKPKSRSKSSHKKE